MRGSGQGRGGKGKRGGRDRKDINLPVCLKPTVSIWGLGCERVKGVRGVRGGGQGRGRRRRRGGEGMNLPVCLKPTVSI